MIFWEKSVKFSYEVTMFYQFYTIGNTKTTSVPYLLYLTRILNDWFRVKFDMNSLQSEINCTCLNQNHSNLPLWPPLAREYIIGCPQDQQFSWASLELYTIKEAILPTNVLMHFNLSKLDFINSVFWPMTLKVSQPIAVVFDLESLTRSSILKRWSLTTDQNLSEC